jgi:diguanylate cyclase (GGDEF)-like protein
MASSGHKASVDANLALASLFAAGALVCVPTLMMNPWAEVWVPGVAVNCLLATLTAVGLYLFRGSAGPVVRHLGMGSGVIVIALALCYGGGGPATALYAVLYLWVGVYVGAQFTHAVAASYMTFATVTGGFALALVCTPAAAITIGTTTLVTAVVVCVVVTVLTDRIRELADRDPLTGLPNRRALEAHLTKLESRRRPQPLALVTLDLDGFKEVNDTQGHAAGDTVLMDVAGCWSSLLRTGDLLARVGGDEFVAVLDGCDAARAADVSERLARATPRPVTVSIGVVCCDGSGSLADQLALADEAVYRSKARGGDAVTALGGGRLKVV